MTYLAIGNKPGVGPVLQVVKNDADDYLNLSKTQWGKFLFNSEIQEISYVKEPWKTVLDPGAYPPGNNFLPAGTNASNCSRGIANMGISNNYYNTFFAFPQTLFPGDFLPLGEMRIKDLSTGRIAGPARVRNWVIFQSNAQRGVMTAYQFPSALMQAVRTGPGDWHGRLPTGFESRVGQWFTLYGSNMNGSDGGRPFEILSGGDQTWKEVVTYWWDLPADQSAVPKPSGPVVPGQEQLRLNSSGLIMCRPGFTVDGSSGRQRIIDSTRNPPLCIMAGETGTIGASGGTTFIAAPPGISLSDDCVVELMARVPNWDLTVPSLLVTGYTPDHNGAVSYSVASNGVTFYNDGPESVIVRYVVFGVDFRPPSTGGNQVMRKANDGVRDYVQIKKPGSSDTAPLPNDILIDTRFPTLSMISEDFIPLSQFTETSNNQERGNVMKTITFQNDGFWPFVKYSVVFPGYILSPMFGQIYHYPSGDYNHRPTSQSALAQVEDTFVRFYLSPGNPSNFVSTSSTTSQLRWDYPDPLGIRYYIFAIPK
ncbi:hypothetical protein M1D80_09495 [Phyllobacteriaceae bacterium JZ32]